MLNVMSFLGVDRMIAEQIVSIINSVGWVAVAAAIIASILSLGGLTVTASILNYVVITVKSYLSRNLWVVAVLW